MLKVYFDNDIASAITRRDLDKSELVGIDELLEANRKGLLAVGTSRQSPRELERAPVRHQAKLKEGLSELDLARNDHSVLGFQTHADQYGGYVANPLVSDIVDAYLYADLLAAGLKSDDAKHFMYAVHNGYQRFLTCDKGFLSRRTALESRCPEIRIQKPSELTSEIITSCETGPAKNSSVGSPAGRTIT
jgi:hypothetical protein